MELRLGAPAFAGLCGVTVGCTRLRRLLHGAPAFASFAELLLGTPAFARFAELRLRCTRLRPLCGATVEVHPPSQGFAELRRVHPPSPALRSYGGYKKTLLQKQEGYYQRILSY